MVGILRTALAVTLLGTPLAASADFYQYETDDGVLSFTDEIERVPSRYEDVAERREDRALADYERLSVSKRGASTASIATSIDLTETERPVSAKSMLAQEPGKMSLRIDDTIVLQVGGEGDEPIYVDRRRYITRNDITTPHTVVSRGDTPLIYISDRPR